MILGWMLLYPPSCTSITNNLSKSVKILNIGKAIYLTITALQFGLLCGFRSFAMAYDTAAYLEIFNTTPSSWNNILNNKLYIEIGFSVLCSIVKIFGGSFQTLLIITSLFTIGSCCLFIYRHSENVLLSVFTIVSFPFYYSTFDIIRHFLAVSFLLLGYKYVIERKPLKFLMFIFIGSLFHKVCWLFIPIYFMFRLKFSAKNTITALIITVISLVFIEDIAVYLSDIFDKGSGVEDGWINSFGGGIRTAFMYLVVFIIALVLFSNIKERTTKDYVAMNFILLLFLFSVLFINARIMTRFIMMCIPFLSISMPQILDSKRINDNLTYQFCFLGFLLIGVVYHIFMLLTNWQNVVPYIPFWENNNYFILDLEV